MPGVQAPPMSRAALSISKTVKELLARLPRFDLSGKILSFDHHTIAVEISAKVMRPAGKAASLAFDVEAQRLVPDIGVVQGLKQRVELPLDGGTTRLAFTFPYNAAWSGIDKVDETKHDYAIVIDQGHEIAEWTELNNSLAVGTYLLTP